jgi:pseudouridine kinase
MNTSAAPIVCIGGLNIDRKLRLLARALPGSSNPAESHETPGGVVRNVAENLARLGLPVALVAAVGDDAGGRMLLEQAAAVGIDMRAVIRCAATPATATRPCSRPTAACAGPGGHAAGGSLNPWALAASQALRAGAALVVADGNLPTDAWPLLLARRAPAACRWSAWPCPRPRWSACPSGRGPAPADPERRRAGLRGARPLQAFAALHARGVARVLVSQGADGLLLSEPGRAPRHWPAPDVPVVDVTGAGDALSAGVCAALLRDAADFDAAARLGLDLAALTLQTEDSVHPEPTPFLEPDERPDPTLARSRRRPCRGGPWWRWNRPSLPTACPGRRTWRRPARSRTSSAPRARCRPPSPSSAGASAWA